jgi:hypothetical protein
MSAETRYKCDVCKDDIKNDSFSNKKAFAFKWSGPNHASLTTDGASPYRDAPVHLCVTCIQAIAAWLGKLK